MDRVDRVDAPSIHKGLRCSGIVCEAGHVRPHPRHVSFPTIESKFSLFLEKIASFRKWKKFKAINPIFTV